MKWYVLKKLFGCIGLILLVGCSTVQSERLSHVPSQVELVQDTALVMIDFDKGVPVIEARINGRGPYRFVLDTGSQALLVSKDLMQQLNLRPTGDVFIQRTPDGQQVRSFGAVHIETLDISGARFRQFTAVVEDLSPYQQVGYVQVDGVIGIDCFTQCQLTVDLPHRRAIIQAGELNGRPIGPRLREDRRRATAIIKPQFVSPWHEQSNVPTLSVEVSNDDNASRVYTMKVDTGYNMGFSFHRRMLESAFQLEPRQTVESVTLAGRHNSRYYQLNARVAIGPVGYIDWPVVEISSDPGRMGAGVLQHLSFTVDRDHRLIALNKNDVSNLMVASKQ